MSTSKMQEFEQKLQALCEEYGALIEAEVCYCDDEGTYPNICIYLDDGGWKDFGQSVN